MKKIGSFDSWYLIIKNTKTIERLCNHVFWKILIEKKNNEVEIVIKTKLWFLRL
jgi:hypothetical protein